MTFDLEDARTRVADLERADAAALRDTLARLTRPRLTGSEGADEVEAALRDRFDELGYHAEALDCEFSEWPGRFGLPYSGVLLFVAAIAGTWLLLVNEPTVALVVLGVAGALAAVPLLWLGPLVLRLPFGRREATNLLFRKPESRPAWIVMAHRDSKSQLVPTALRTVAIGVAALAWLALLVLAALQFGGPDLVVAPAIWAAGVALAAAGLAMGLSWAGNRSPGALDNGSGLAALLEIARRVGTGDVAFLLTEGEELGLAGARAVAGDLPPIQGVINLDGLDDRGAFIVAEGKGWRRRGKAPQLAAALLTAGQALELDVERRPLPRSFLTDHLPIAEAGIPALTVLRGTWRSLGRIHTPADSPDRLRCEGAALGADLVSAALVLLREDPGSHLAAGARVRA